MPFVNLGQINKVSEPFPGLGRVKGCPPQLRLRAVAINRFRFPKVFKSIRGRSSSDYSDARATMDFDLICAELQRIKKKCPNLGFECPGSTLEAALQKRFQDEHPLIVEPPRRPPTEPPLEEPSPPEPPLNDAASGPGIPQSIPGPGAFTFAADPGPGGPLSVPGDVLPGFDGGGSTASSSGGLNPFEKWLPYILLGVAAIAAFFLVRRFK